MRRLKRTAIRVKPKRAYIEWANSLEVGGVKLGQDFTPEETVYLVEEGANGRSTPLERYYQAIFEEELGAWHRLEDAWPRLRDLTTFLAWFDIEVHSLVIDLGGRWVRSERYERY
jgi:hypothetical protein